MRIADVRARILEVEASTSVTIGIGTYARYSCVLVEVEDEGGVVGYGEAIARRAPEMAVAAVESLFAPVLRGRDPRDIGALWTLMMNQLRQWGHAGGVVVEALSGVDTALWDLVSVAAGEPVWRMLHGAGRRELPVYASSVTIGPVDWMREVAAEQVASGYTAVKVKVGRSEADGGMSTDVEAVRRVREAIGPRVGLYLDANGAYDGPRAMRIARLLEDLDVGWLEEPLPPDDLDGYERLRRTCRIPLARGETDFSVFTFTELFRRGLVDVVQPDIARCGGITGAWQIATLAHAHNVAFAPHTGLSGGISQLAAMQVAAAAPSLLALEHMIIDNPLRDIFVGGYPDAAASTVMVPQGPGLGLELDRSAVDGMARPANSGALDTQSPDI